MGFEVVYKKAIDVLPYYNDLLYLDEKDNERTMPIVHRQWTENGKEIIFGLDNHMSYFSKPYEEMAVVEVKPKSENCSWFITSMEKDKKRMQDRPCTYPKCSGTGNARCL